MIIKHITGPKQCKTALTSFIIRVVLQCALFSVHESGKHPVHLYGNTVSIKVFLRFFDAYYVYYIMILCFPFHKTVILSCFYLIGLDLVLVTHVLFLSMICCISY